MVSQCQTPQVQGKIPNLWTALTSARSKFRGLWATRTSDQLAASMGSSHNTPQVRYFTKTIHRTQESIFTISFIKDTNQDQSNEKTHRTRSEWVLNACPLPMESEHITLRAHQSLHQRGSSSELQCPEFLLRFYYTGMRIIDQEMELNLQPLSFLKRSRGQTCLWPNATTF